MENIKLLAVDGSIMAESGDLVSPNQEALLKERFGSDPEISPERLILPVDTSNESDFHRFSANQERRVTGARGLIYRFSGPVFGLNGNADADKRSTDRTASRNK